MVVRMRRNHSQTAKRRSHHGLKATGLAAHECGALHIPHRACPSCGKYNGRVVVDVVARAKKEVRRAKRKQTELRESGQTSETKEKTAASA